MWYITKSSGGILGIFKSRKGRMALPNRMNFLKFQTAFDPPLIFEKLCCKLFIMDMVEYMQGGTRAR